DGALGQVRLHPALFVGRLHSRLRRTDGAPGLPDTESRLVNLVMGLSLRLLQVRQCAIELGTNLRRLAIDLRRLNRTDELPGTDAVTFGDIEADNAARDLRLHFHLPERLHRTGLGDLDFHITAFHDLATGHARAHCMAPMDAVPEGGGSDGSDE